MRSTKESITLPLLRGRGEMLAMGWMVLICGVVPVLLLLLEPMASAELLMLCVLMLGFGVPGCAILVSCFMRLHLVPEGAAVSLFGRTLARYPVENLTVIRWDADQTDGPRMNRLVLSTLSVEELADRRERKLRASVITRDGVDYQKRRRDWQEAFAIEQLKKMTRLGEFFPVRRSVLWLQDSPETTAILKLAYPDAAWHDLRRGPEKTYMRPSEKSKARTDTPQSFRRNHEGLGESAGAILMVTVFLVPSLVFMLLGIVLAEIWAYLAIIGSALAMVWLFGSLGVMGVFFFGSEQVSLEDAGIRIRPKFRKERLIPVEELRNAWCLRMNAKGGALGYLVFSSHTREELVQMEENRMSQNIWGREELSALRLLDHWPELAVRRLLLRRMSLFGYDDPMLLLMAYTNEREAWIRERYPHLQVIDLRD